MTATGVLLAVGSLCCAPAFASAVSSTYRVTLQTGNLNGQGMFGLDFLLQNGETTNPLRATIQNFRMTGGNLVGSGGTTAGSQPVTGNLASSLVLSTTNGGDFGEFTRNFNVTSGSGSIAFDVTLTANAVQASSADPDFFSFSVLDGTSTPLPTDSPTDGTSLVYAPFDRPAPRAQTYDATSPIVTVQATAAPEPNSVLLSWFAGVCGTAHWAYKRKAVRAKARKLSYDGL